jgi:hypothetical protein
MTVVVSHHSTITRMKAAVALVVAAALEVMTLPVRAVVGQMYMITATTTAMVALAVEASRMEDPPMKSKTLNQPSAQCRMLLVDLPLLACSRLS